MKTKRNNHTNIYKYIVLCKEYFTNTHYPGEYLYLRNQRRFEEDL